MSGMVMELDTALRSWRQTRSRVGPASDETFEASVGVLRSWLLADPQLTPLFGEVDPEAEVATITADARQHRGPEDAAFIDALTRVHAGPEPACVQVLQERAAAWGPWAPRTVEVAVLACLRWPGMPASYRTPIAQAVPTHPAFGAHHPLTVLLLGDARRAEALQPPLPLTLLPHLRALTARPVQVWQQAGGGPMTAPLPPRAGSALELTGDDVRRCLPQSVEIPGDERTVPVPFTAWLDRALDLLGLPACVHGPRLTLRWKLADGLLLAEARFVHDDPATGRGRWVASARWLSTEQAEAHDAAVVAAFIPDNHANVDYLWYFEPYGNQMPGEPATCIAGYSSSEVAESQQMVELMTSGLASCLRGLPGRLRTTFRLDWDNDDERIRVRLLVSADQAVLLIDNVALERVVNPTDADVTRLVRRLYLEAQGRADFASFAREAMFIGVRSSAVSAG